MTEQTLRGYGCSHQQKRLWSLRQHGIEGRVQYVLLLEGQLDRERLREAVASVAARHEILRTTFQQPSGLKVPVQIVNETNVLSWSEADIEIGNAPVRDVVRALLETGPGEPLRPDNGSSLRFTLARVTDASHLLAVTASPLVTDVESLHRLVDEAAQIYAGDRADTLAEPLQYAAFAAWQAEMSEDEEATLGRKYWRSQDIGAVLGIAHPLVKPSRDSQPFRAEYIELSIAPDVVAAIDEVAERTGTSASLQYLACWRGLLGRLTGVEDVPVAYRMTGRTDEELESAIGPFASFLPLRCPAANGSSYQAIAQNISEILERARDWEPYFSWEDVTADGTSAGSAFVPFAFEFLNCPSAREAAGITFTPIRQLECIDGFDLKLSCSRQGAALVAELHYSPDLFSRDTARRLADQYEATLRSAIARPAADLASLDVLGVEERTRTVDDFNATRVEFQSLACVHRLFETQVARCADRCAVVYEDGALTYAALSERADGLAARLRSLGIGPGRTVGVRVERSLDTIVAMLGILKAGGAYVPLDTSLPQLRLEMLLSEAQISVVVTHRALAPALPRTGVAVVVLDEIPRADEAGPASRSATVEPQDLAYVLFTSGTTGVPKGVAVEHRQVVNYVRGLVERLSVSDGEHMATVSTFAADLGNTVIYAALTTGGTLHVVSERRRSDPDATSDYFARWRIDCLKIVPSHLDALLSASAPQHVVSCRRIVLGGEATTWTLIDRIEALSSTCEVFNHYGPTETTVGATTYPLSRGERDAHGETLPIGRPLPNCRAYVLGSGGTPEPVGVSGELHIGGDGVSRGYLNRPAETAARFVPDPFGDGGRLYRTGDRVRHLPSRNIEFRGRVDDQIKIRGYRVEQAEVEAVLANCPAVRQGVVVARHDAGNAARLVAYVVLQQGAAVEQVKRFVEEYLPDYMVPSGFVTLPALPLNRNGKVDRGALPAPEDSSARADVVAPRNACEQQLAEIWSILLHREAIGVHDNFFELGGHSLSAMQLVSRIRQRFDVEVPLLTIFEEPTIAELATRISGAAASVPPRAVPQIATAARDGVIPASFSQERLWLFEQLQPGSSAYNVPTAVHVRGPLDVAALEQTIQAVIDRHEVFRTTFNSIDGRPVQVIAPPGPVEVSLVDLRQLPLQRRAGQLDALVQAHAKRPFDLMQGPVWRAAAVKIDHDEHVVLWNQHHISSDAWSAGLFGREISHFYSSFAAGRPSALPPLAIQYADFSQWQRDWLGGAGKAEQVAYWKERLDGAPPALAMPTDRPRPPVQSYRGGAESVVLTPTLSRALVALARQENATTYITLLSALNALLYLHAGQSDIVVGSPTAGRTQQQTEHLIGFFLNTLALRTKVKAEASFRDLLREVRAGVLGAFAHQDLPFEQVVEALQVERDMSRPVLYQVMFNHQKASGERFVLGNLQLTPIAPFTASSKFDLTLYATEGREQTTLRIVYNADIFEGATIAAMLARFVVLLQAIVANPDRQVSSLPLLTDEERKPHRARPVLPAIPQEFVTFERDDVEATIGHRFEQQVAADPERPAVKTQRYEWTYRELELRARTVARRIQAVAGRSDTRVGLLFEKDAPLLAGILGALKSGQTYVPLDPSNPRDRLVYMLKHSEAGVLLTDAANLTVARELAGDSVAVLSVQDGAPTDEPFECVRPASPDSIAYILYTSGSTGLPKGVVQSHRNVLHFMRVYTNNLGLNRRDRLSLLSSYGFDGAVMDIFGALLNGATLIPVRLRDEGWGDALRRIIDERVTVFHSTPTVFRQLFDGRDSNGPSAHVRAVVLGGEEALNSDVELFKRCFGPTAFLVNGLGPSESTVTLQHFVQHDTIARQTSLPVGLPVEDTEVVLLDAGGRPTDVYGEIAIRSAHVALGYWRDEEKTRAAFSMEPDESGRRVYRTGDIGRRLPDGTLAFVGRKDSQVKVRGYRIELGEIESVLTNQAGLRDAVVTVREDVPGDRRLVAYLVLDSVRSPSTSDVRSTLRKLLPEYMIPTAFVTLTELPLTASGKVDRRALPAPERTWRGLSQWTDAGSVALRPSTETEIAVARIWQSVLATKEISVNDKFFDLGGHSMSAMQVITRLEAELGYVVKFNDLVYQTLRQIAAACDKRRRGTP